MEVLSVKRQSLWGPVRDFATCRGIAKGPVFIVASGSSAKDFPLQRFADIPMITLNGAISMFEGSGIRPFFYVCTDTGFPLQQPDLYASALSLSRRLALWPDEIEAAQTSTSAEIYPLTKASRSTLYESAFNPQPDLVRSREFWRSRSRTLGFSKDLSAGYFDARTVAYAALQIAYHVGFTQVFLVGVDLTQAAGRFYETAGRAISPCGLDDYFESRILPSMKLMADRVVDERFSVYNLSQTSRIPDAVIPKVSVEQAEDIIFSGLSF
ncbi:lipopolysaccharide biosynthesis protein [Pseudomonas sp. SWI6]|uniref:LPS biosynthesis protein n=1 Tax=Pseudomonas TaxID=286 RepID=UPI0004036308|nr:MULTISPECIES: LPS biosynthesis protein [Pseudomonas]AVD84295.1 lipopolysaccharide biosynthesis protein [Pseudomonas sp. SWI6]MDT8922042.1 lipopolysaccharide biosynthesis protein [Pseudomonas taiwanensis]QQZ37612.1 lipopolysaccharide biosynthesis protein [Pseudomonas sp. SK2]